MTHSFKSLIRWSFCLLLFLKPLTAVLADETGNGEIDDDTPDIETETIVVPADETSNDEVDDDTPDVETETTVDYTEALVGLKIDGDIRPMYDDCTIDDRDGASLSEHTFGFRARLRADIRITSNHPALPITGTEPETTMPFGALPRSP